MMDDLLKRQLDSLNNDIQKYLKDYIIAEGYLQKQSRYLRLWRKRWVILYRDKDNQLQLCTFKHKEHYDSPTEIITIDTNIELKQDVYKKDEFYIHTKSTQNLFRFKCLDETESTWWLETIARAIMISATW